MAIITFTSASGVGKGALMRSLYKLLPERVHLLTSTTTRAPRAQDLQFGLEAEYEYLSEERFEQEAHKQAFIKVFGDYGNRYGTREQRFSRALFTADELYLAALFTPAVERFVERAAQTAYPERVYPVFLDLKDEDERHRRLTNRGDTDPKRFKPELERRRQEVAQSSVPFFRLDAAGEPEHLARHVLEHFKL